MKTQRLTKEKQKAPKFYNAQTGIYRSAHVVSNIIKYVLLAVAYKFVLFIVWDFNISIDIQNFESTIYQYLYMLKKVYINTLQYDIYDQKTQLFYTSDLLIICYVIVATVMYIRSRKVLKLSNLGLENYKLKKQKNGYLLRLKHGEEVEFDYVINIRDDIKQVLKINENRSVAIKRSGARDILIELLPVLQQYDINLNMMKDGYVYFGKSREHGDIYINLNELTHYLIAGASGSGKSVFQNLLIASFLHNIEHLKNLYLVDLKGGKVEFGRYQNFAQNVTVIGDISSLLGLTRELISVMTDRYEMMSEKGITKLTSDAIIVMIDEYASVETQLHELKKVDAKELKNNLKTLLAKARASNIKFFIATQKATSDSIDTTLRENLQSKILMKTKSKDAQRAVLNDLEVLDELDINPSKFLKGQYVMQDDVTGNDYYIQAPFAPDNFYLKLQKDTNTNENSLNEIALKNNEYLYEKSRCIINRLFVRYDRKTMKKIIENKKSKLYKYASLQDKTQMSTLVQLLDDEKKKQSLKSRVNDDIIDVKSFEETSDNALGETIEIINKGENKMIELTLDEQVQIRKKTYSECKHIKDDVIRKDYFKKLRDIKHNYHEQNNKYDDVDFDDLIDDARTEIKRAKQSDAGAEADVSFDVSVSEKSMSVANALE